MPRACTGRLPVTCLNIPTSMWPSWTLHFQPLCKPVVAAAHKHSTPGRPLSRLPALSLRVLMLRLMRIPKRLQQAPGCAKSSRRRRLHQQPGLRYSQADLRHNKLAGHTQRTSPRVSSLMGQKVWFLMFIGNHVSNPHAPYFAEMKTSHLASLFTQVCSVEKAKKHDQGIQIWILHGKFLLLYCKETPKKGLAGACWCRGLRLGINPSRCRKVRCRTQDDPGPTRLRQS